MKLDKIISFANSKSEIRFLAMVRSLRATGCNLPVWVIPYDENKFDLPENCIWWEVDEIEKLIMDYNLHPMKRKFQCFLTQNYQYVDADIIFLKNPEKELEGNEGFVTSCTHWNNPLHTYVASTLEILKNHSTTWQKTVFNSGQFACSEILYDIESLEKHIKNPSFKEALDAHDQISINLFVFLSKVKITNLTLPPRYMESTWAGDYLADDFEKYWTDEGKKPYLIHWAGFKIAIDKPIDKLFTQYLNEEERKKMFEELEIFMSLHKYAPVKIMIRKIKNFLKFNA